MPELFGEWHEKSGVRRAPHRLFCDETDAGRVLFPASLMPYLGHPLIQNGDPGRVGVLQVARLYDYLRFVANLEAKVVNIGTLAVALDEFGLELPSPVRLDAWKIYCDEAHHAMSSYDMVNQVEAATGVPVLTYDFEPTLRELRLAGAPLRGIPGLAGILDVVVFETVVTSLLSDIPADPTVVTAIREVVGDHARDERLHHAFYTRFFSHLWGRLDPATRELAARALPGIMIACLRPDLPAFRRHLTAVGLGPPIADEILGATYTDAVVLADIRQSARHTLRMFALHGVFDLPGAREQFVKAGLLSDGDLR